MFKKVGFSTKRRDNWKNLWLKILKKSGEPKVSIVFLNWNAKKHTFERIVQKNRFYKLPSFIHPIFLKRFIT